VYADHLRSKATVRGNAAMLRFMISGILWTYIHTQCLQMMLKPLILNYSSMFTVQSINKNHLKNQPEKCHEQLTKIAVSVISGSRNVKPIFSQQPRFLKKTITSST